MNEIVMICYLKDIRCNCVVFQVRFVYWIIDNVFNFWIIMFEEVIMQISIIFSIYWDCIYYV